MNVAIVGSNGFIGRNLIDKLSQDASINIFLFGKSDLSRNNNIPYHKIDKITNFKSEKKYFLLIESALEIPLDVYFFFKKHKKLSENKLKYYYTDFEYYSIDNNLNYNKILKHYISEIQKTKPELIIMNHKKIALGKDKKN